MGGQLAVLFARDHPKAQGLCLIAPTGMCDPPASSSFLPCLETKGGAHPNLGKDQHSWERCQHPCFSCPAFSIACPCGFCELRLLLFDLRLTSRFFSVSIRCFFTKGSAASADFFGMQSALFDNTPDCKETIKRCENLFSTEGVEGDVAKVMSRMGRRVYVVWGRQDEVVPYAVNFERWKKLLDEVSVHVRNTQTPLRSGTRDHVTEHRLSAARCHREPRMQPRVVRGLKH